MRLSQQIRDAIETCGVSRYRLSKLTGIGEATLSKFMTGRQGLSLAALDLLADELDLNLAPIKPRKGQVTHGTSSN